MATRDHSTELRAYGIDTRKGPSKIMWHFLFAANDQLHALTSYAELSELFLRVLKVVYVGYDEHTQLARPTPIYVFQSLQQIIQYLRATGHVWVDESKWHDSDAFTWLYILIGAYNGIQRETHIQTQQQMDIGEAATNNVKIIEFVFADSPSWNDLNTQLMKWVRTDADRNMRKPSAVLFIHAFAACMLATGMRFIEAFEGRVEFTDGRIFYARVKTSFDGLVPVHELVGKHPAMPEHVYAAKVHSVLMSCRRVFQIAELSSSAVQQRMVAYLRTQGGMRTGVATHILRKLYACICVHRRGLHMRSVYEQANYVERILNHMTRGVSVHYLSAEARLPDGYVAAPVARSF